MRLFKRNPETFQTSGMPKVNPVPIISLENGIAFMWSAKSGCTSFGRAILKHIGAFSNTDQTAINNLPDDHPDYVSAMRNAHNQRNGIDARSAGPLMVTNDLYVFKTVRHPFTRMLSAYLMLMRSDINGNPDRTGICSALRRRFGVTRSSLTTFRQFVTWLSEIRVEHADIHIRPQKQEIESRYPNLIDFLIRLESIESDVRELEHKLGGSLLAEIQRRGQHATKRSGSELEDAMDYPFEMYASCIPPEYCFSDSEIMAVTRRIYACDFEEYGYKVYGAKDE